MRVAEYDSHWNRLKETQVQLEDACFAPHDFAITPKHFVFFQVQSASRCKQENKCHITKSGSKAVSPTWPTAQLTGRPEIGFCMTCVAMSQLAS